MICCWRRRIIVGNGAATCTGSFGNGSFARRHRRRRHRRRGMRPAGIVRLLWGRWSLHRVDWASLRGSGLRPLSFWILAAAVFSLFTGETRISTVRWMNSACSLLCKQPCQHRPQLQPPHPHVKCSNVAQSNAPSLPYFIYEIVLVLLTQRQ